MSDPVSLRVQYAPVCVSEDVVIVGASLDEAVKVRCQVSADPTDVNFVWQFNNSGENIEAAPTTFGTANGSTSQLMYTPLIERDYGTLTCWGRNNIGRQSEPCVFQVVPAAYPGALRNCSLKTASNITQDVLEVECIPGYDGGMTQHFVLEAYESRTMRLRLNLSSDVPTFRIDLSDLLPTSAYTPMLHVVLYAQNQKGRSEAFVLEDIALKDAEKRTESVLGSTSGLTAVPLTALLCGLAIVISLAILFIIVLTARKRRQSNSGYPRSTSDVSKQKNSLLEINDSDRRYVVSYMLKTPADCKPDHQERQPDILNAPRGKKKKKKEKYTYVVSVDYSPKRPDDNFFNRNQTDIEDCNRNPSISSSHVSSFSSELNSNLSVKSDGTLRQNKKNVVSRNSPLAAYQNVDGIMFPGGSRQNPPPPPPPTSASPSEATTLTRSNRNQSKTPTTKTSVNGELEQRDNSLGSIPGPESCV
ncbi:sidestep protein, putative [Pediculus humanus corporis]|uniref:Sidestep protein, putative n=1 Tax=Pediculus humanus subsp. corporis TaxID=121224 RepID=E0V963_PEDHC|nr:sidestep protein, putative [Pediculus humanus corporis]EEB09919.1 sidestep protein, putative [Pediculus humanus corporis]